MRAWWEGFNTKLDPLLSSNGYYVGIQVYENTTGTFGEILPPIKISESDEEARELYIASTVPILCRLNCDLDIRIKSVEEDGPGQILSVCKFT